jgi:hypothetical protein
MKIAELEAEHAASIASAQAIRAMVARREFSQVFATCIESLPHIVPALQFRKKRDIVPVMPELTAAVTICQFAPPLFEHAAIESLWEYVKSARLLAQHDSGLLNTVESARRREHYAHVLWNHLEKHPGLLQQDIPGETEVPDDEAKAIVALWEAWGIVAWRMDDAGDRLHFCTRLDDETTGLCPGCGVRGKGRKDLFFRLGPCKKCGTEGHYHIEYGVPP